MRILFHLSIFMLFSLFAQAQQIETDKCIVSGKITDSLTQKPVGYATMTLYDANHKNIGASYSLENGTFRIPLKKSAVFHLEISMVGYTAKRIDISIGESQTVLSLETIYLTASSDQLSEVTVTASRKLIDKKPGMLVYIAENDVTNKGGTAADVLRKAPVINVDAQGNVSMRGNSNIKILVNGKYSGQMARSVSDALNMMPADNIKSVEVITNPSAKYDAEGAAGVINIITKNNGGKMSGTLELSASNLEQMVNPRFSMSKGKWNMTVNGHLHRLLSKTISDIERVIIDNGSPSLFLDQNTYKKNAAPHGSGDIAITYADSVSELSFGMNAWFGNWPDDRNLTTGVRLPNGNITEQYFQNIDTRANYLGSDINIGYNRKLRWPGQEITLLAQFSPSSDGSWYHTLQTDKNKQLLYGELNDNKTRNREWTIQADYIQPLSANGKYVFETGLKIITRNVGNRYDVETSNSQDPESYIPQPARSDHFKYKQNVWAGYTLVKLNFKQGWYLEAGARIEHTFLEGNFTKAGTSFDNRFTNLIPTGTLSKKIDESQTVSINYTRRLTRPYIWDLNPNADLSDPKNIVSGNPELQPETADQAEISYGWSAPSGFFINSSVFWRRTGNAIVDFISTDSAGISFANKQNLASNKVYGLNLSTSAKLNDRLHLNSNLNISYLDYTSQALRIFNSGWGADLNVNATQKLPRNYTVQAFGEYDTRIVTLQGNRGRRYYYSIAIKKDLPERKMMLTLSFVNPFSKALTQTQLINNAYFISTIRNQYFNRAFKLTLNWDFGKAFEQRERKKISNDDINVQGKG